MVEHITLLDKQLKKLNTFWLAIPGISYTKIKWAGSKLLVKSSLYESQG